MTFFLSQVYLNLNGLQYATAGMTLRASFAKDDSLGRAEQDIQDLNASLSGVLGTFSRNLRLVTNDTRLLKADFETVRELIDFEKRQREKPAVKALQEIVGTLSPEQKEIFDQLSAIIMTLDKKVDAQHDANQRILQRLDEIIAYQGTNDRNLDHLRTQVSALKIHKESQVDQNALLVKQLGQLESATAGLAVAQLNRGSSSRQLFGSRRSSITPADGSSGGGTTSKKRASILQRLEESSLSPEAISLAKSSFVSPLLQKGSSIKGEGMKAAILPAKTTDEEVTPAVISLKVEDTSLVQGVVEDSVLAASNDVIVPSIEATLVERRISLPERQAQISLNAEPTGAGEEPNASNSATEEPKVSSTDASMKETSENVERAVTDGALQEEVNADVMTPELPEDMPSVTIAEGI